MHRRTVRCTDNTVHTATLTALTSGQVMDGGGWDVKLSDQRIRAAHDVQGVVSLLRDTSYAAGAICR